MKLMMLTIYTNSHDHISVVKMNLSVTKLLSENLMEIPMVVSYLRNHGTINDKRFYQLLNVPQGSSNKFFYNPIFRKGINFDNAKCCGTLFDAEACQPRTH